MTSSTPGALELRIVRGALSAEARNAQREWTTREAILVRLRGSDGHLGQGEAAPLPGYSSESLRECLEALRALDLRGVFDCDGEVSVQLARVGSLIPACLPAARCAVETAVLDLLGKRRALPAWSLVCPGVAPEPRELAALWSPLGGPEWDAILRRGPGTLKVKVGPPERIEEQARVLQGLSHAAPGLRLRLDANRSFAQPDVGRCLHQLAGLPCEFVEEPSADLDLGGLAGSGPLPGWVAPLCTSPLPIALDESLQPPGAELGLARLSAIVPLVAVVLKPMALGVRRCLAIAGEARRLRLGVVFSHLFDGPIGLALAGTLGLVSGSHELAMGLDRHPGLGIWPPASLPMFAAGQLRPTADPGLGLGELDCGSPP